MNGWRLTFKYREGRNDVDIELRGGDAVMKRGLDVAVVNAGPALARRMSIPRALPPGWRADVEKLVRLQRGLEPLGEYKGRFLRVRPDDASGLSMSVSVAWED